MTIGAIAFVVVAVLSIVGVLVYQHYEHAHIRSENMAQFKAWCDEAKKKAEGGDNSAKETFKECVKNVKPPEPAKDPIEIALYVLGGVLGLYVIGYYVVPKLIAHGGQRRSSTYPQVADAEPVSKPVNTGYRSPFREKYPRWMLP